LKKFLILIIVIIFSSLTFADDNFRVAPLQTILQSANLVDSEDIRTKLTLDFFKYYKLETQYDTPLKKKMYMQSKEYQDKLAEFNGLKKEVASKRYYLSCGSVGEYDLKKKGFWFCIDYNEIYYRSDQTLSRYQRLCNNPAATMVDTVNADSPAVIPPATWGRIPVYLIIE